MTTYILIMFAIIILLLIVILTKKSNLDLSSLHEDNYRLREKLAERIGILIQNAMELKNISSDISSFKDLLLGSKQATSKRAFWRKTIRRFNTRYNAS